MSDNIKNVNTDEVVCEANDNTAEAAVTEADAAPVMQVEYTEDGGLSGLTEKQRRRNEIIDKITTGILILLLASPVAILLYIFLWFILK